MPIEFDEFVSNPRFQKSTPDVKLKALDLLSDTMFKEGRLDDVERALQFRASTELQALSQAPANQFMGALSTGLLGSEADPSIAFGADYDRIQRDYQQKVSALKSEPGIIQTGPEDFYYTRKNPFGQGTLVEHGGGKSFIPQGMGDPNTIGETLRSAGLEPIKKDAIFGDTLSRANEYTKVGELLQDDSFQILPQGDQRTLLRSFANNRNAQGDVLGRDEAQEMLQAMDQQWDATLRSGQFAPTDKPWYDFFTSAVDRGSSSYFQNKDIKLIKRKYELINRLQDTLTPEQREYLDSPGVRESLVEFQKNLPGAHLDPANTRPRLKDALVGTPLEGVSTWKLSSYLGAVESPEYKLAEAEYETRNKAMALIGNTQGMEQFTQTQTAVKDQGGSGWEQAVVGIGAFAANPLDVAFNVTLQSMVSQPGAMASNMALFAIPGPTQGRAAINTFNMVRGTAVGLIAGATESSFAYTNALESRRTNPDGTQKPLGEMFTDYQTMRAVNDEAMARGAAIGTISGVTGYLLPGAMGQLERFYLNKAAAREAAPGLGSALGFNATQIAAQMASEAKGEYWAEVLSGQEVNIGEIILEAGGGLGDAATMWQGTPGFAAARQALTVQQQADAAVALARAQAVDAAIVEPGAAVTESAPTQGIFARGLSPQVEIGPVDANGNADITVFVEEASMEAVPTPQATVDQGLESVTPEVARRSPDLPPLPAVPQEVEEAAQREMEALSTQTAEPIQSASALVEGQPISWLMPDGSTQSGVVADLQGSSFTVNGEPQSFTPGKYFSNEVKPKQNARKLTRGDVLFDGDTFYRYDDETYDDFAVGQKTPDGKVQFDKSERRELEEGFINDPRVKIYAKADFDRAMQDYNGRQNPLPEDRFTDILNNTPEKAEPAASPDTQAGIVEPTEPTTESGTPQGPTVAEVNERAATPVLSNPVTSNRTVLFKLRTHKDVAGLLSKAVGRWEQWSKATKILEESPDAIVYVKDAKIQELHRNQAPETFDDTVARLRKEDAANRDAREPQAWSEVAAYRELERYLKDRVARTQLSRNKNKRSSGILEYAQISTTIEALFIQDKAIAAYAAAKFGLYTPNASLITVEDVADLRYGNIERWVNANSFSSATGGYEAVNRTLNLGGNASVEDVFHELYHDFFENIAPLILTTGQYSKLQKLIESNLTKPAVRSFLEKRGYALTPKKAQNRGINYEAQYQFRDGLGNISIAAHEAFTQLMTTYHFSQRNPRGVTPETRRILGVISDFFARTFQDWNKEPLPILTDDAKDLLDNFFTTPPPLRRLAFRPSIRSGRIDNEAQETTEEIERINRAIRGEEEYADVPPEPVATLSSPNTLGEVLNERFHLGRAPNLNENFTVGNRTYQLTSTGIFEVLDGILAYPRDIEDIPYDGQQEFQQTGTTRTDGTTTITPDDVEEVSSSVVPVGPVRRVQLPQDGKKAAQSILVDSTNGQTLGQRPYNPDPNGSQDTEARTGPNVMLEPGDFILIPDSQELARVVANPQETYLEVWDGKKWNRAVYDPQAVRTLFDISKARRYKSKSESTAKGQLNRSPGGSPSQFTLGIAQTILRENGRNYYVGVPSKPKFVALTELNKQFERGKLPYEDYVAQVKDLLGLPKSLAKSKKARPVGIWENDVTMPKANWRFMYNRQERQRESAQDFGVANASRKTQADKAAQLIFQTPREGSVHRDDGTAFSYGKNGIYANVIARKGVRPLMDTIRLVRQNGWKKVLHTGPISGPRALDFLRALMAANPDFTFYGSFNQKELESRITSGFLDNKAMSKTEQRNMRLAASQFYASQGLTEADVLNWLDSLPEDQRTDAQFYFEHSPEDGTVNFSRQKGRRYEVPSFSKRIIGGQGTVSATVKEIAAESTYPVAENNFIIQAVESRIASQKTLMAAHRDLASLRRKNLDQLDAVFDPQRTRAGIGLAALTYYTATVMKRFDSLVGDMHAGREPKDDLPLAQDIMFSLVKMMEYLNRTSGRAVNINRETFAYDPDTIINAIEIDLVKNSPARKRFIAQAVAFKKKFGEIAPEWSDTQLKEAMQLEGINPIFLPAMRNFANNQGHLRDLEAEADALFVQAKISPFISEAVRRNIKQIATIVQMSQSQWTKGFFAQMAHMAVEKERGTGLLDLASALPYNNTLTGIGVVTMNMVGSVMNYFSNLSSFALYWVGQDLIQGRGADALLKNAMAVTYGMLSPKWGLGSVPEGLTNVSQVALSGYRGDSVEAFTKAMGVTVNTATALYGRVGTKAAERNFVNMMKRAVTIMLIDAGRRAATAPDAFFKTVAENSFTGAMLYREAWDSWTLVRGTTNESRSDYIANYIEGRLGLKSMDQYRLDAQKVIDAHADVIMANSVSLLPREQELSSLRDLIAFNLRKEAREAALQGTPEGSQIVTDARNFAFSTSFSNQTKGAFRQIEDILEKMTDWGITPYLKGVDRTLAIQKGGPDRPSVDMRVRLGTSNPLQFMFLPFRGNLVRMLEEALNWTPLGAANRLITNQRYPDTYSQLEVYSSLVKGTIGMGLMGIAASALGMFDDEDEDKPVRRGVTGYKSLRTLGRNGQETIVPPYSAWAFNSEGDVVIGRFRDFPQLVATLGTMATWKEAYRDNPQNNFGGMMWQGGVSFAATTTDLGLYDAMSDMANRLKADPQADPSKQVMRFNEALAKNAKIYTLPLNRLQRDLLGLTRGYEVMPARGDFWATYVANTYAEGMLSEEQSNNLAKIVGPTGEVKSPQLLNRFMQTIEQPSEGLKWMLGNGYVLQKTDYTKPVSSAFPTTATKERAAVIFEEMNNGMFYVKHAPEIEKAAAKYYWPWISAYAADGKRKAELQSFVDSPTNELRERQGSSQHKSLRELEQSDINSMVNKARQIASLEISAEYYTDNPRVKQWIAGIAVQEARKGPNLKDSREIRGLQGTSEGTPQPVGR